MKEGGIMKGTVYMQTLWKGGPRQEMTQTTQAGQRPGIMKVSRHAEEFCKLGRMIEDPYKWRKLGAAVATGHIIKWGTIQEEEL